MPRGTTGAIVAVHNLSPESCTVPLTLDGCDSSHQLVDLLQDGVDAADRRPGRVEVALEGYGYRWLRRGQRDSRRLGRGALVRGECRPGPVGPRNRRWALVASGRAHLPGGLLLLAVLLALTGCTFEWQVEAAAGAGARRSGRATFPRERSIRPLPRPRSRP